MARVSRSWIVAACFVAIGVSNASGVEPYVSLPRAAGAALKIEAALGERTSLKAEDLSLDAFAALVKRRHGVEIQLDNRALTDAGLVGWDTRLSCDFNGISLRSALRLVLSQFDLTYVVRYDALLITSETEAENAEVVRIYPVVDLVNASDEFVPGARRAEPDENSRNYADIQTLVEVVSSVVSPTSWDEGNAIMGQFHHLQNGRFLAIRQTQDVHEEIEELFASLRAVRNVQRKWGAVIAKQAPGAAADDPDAPTLRVYEFRSPSGAGAAPDQSQIDRLAKSIPAGIEPETWGSRGGRGTIAAISGALVVRQTAEIHRRLEDLLRGVVSFHCYERPRLAPDGPRVDWPQQAEPRPFGATAKIEQALQDTGPIEFTNQPLNEIARRLEALYSIEVELDRLALADEGIDPDATYALHCQGASLRSALLEMLEPAGLTFTVRNEALLITSQTEAENLLSTRVYPVLDLVVRPAGESPSRPMLDYAALKVLILRTIARGSWEETGGPGAIQSFPNCGALVISQTDEIHREIAALLNSIRRAGAQRL